MNLFLVSARTLKIDTYCVETSLDNRLSQFWELESLGIMKNETSVYEKFVLQIKLNGQKYEVKLPSKEHHPPLLDHHNLSHEQLIGLFKQLRQNSTASLQVQFCNMGSDGKENCRSSPQMNTSHQ